MEASAAIPVARVAAGLAAPGAPPVLLTQVGGRGVVGTTTEILTCPSAAHRRH
jgi:hypothetical protein